MSPEEAEKLVEMEMMVVDQEILDLGNSITASASRILRPTSSSCSYSTSLSSSASSASSSSSSAAASSSSSNSYHHHHHPGSLPDFGSMPQDLRELKLKIEATESKVEVGDRHECT
jgi:exo-beta-1,3-glucanase (GH17 family)